MAQNDPSPDFQSKLAHAWTEWLQPLGIIIVAAVGYALYKFEIIGERFTGMALVLSVIFGVLLSGWLPALKPARRGTNRMLLWLVLAFSLGGSLFPTLHMALSPAALASAQLTTAQPKATLTTDSEGPYELVVSGAFKDDGQQEVEASYTVTVEGNGKEEVSDDIKRSVHRYKTSRKGGTSTSMEERTETIHRLEHVSGHSIVVSTDGIDDKLDGSLTVGIRAAGPRREIFWTLSILAILLGLVLDVRIAADMREEDRKARGPKRESTYLTVVTAIVFVFSIDFPMEATPHTLVRSAVGAFFLGLLAGGAGGWVLAAFGRLATRPSRKTT
ncbi:MAG: hypothetical protein ABI321_01065 [Polyangia bacterium]